MSVNENFERNGFERSYTLNKLETWTGNSLYRWRCIQKQHKPQSWRPKGDLAGMGVVSPMESGLAEILPVINGAGLDSACEQLKRNAETVRYRNTRPRDTDIAKSFRADESGTAVKSSAGVVGANRLVALSAVCVATLQNAPLLTQDLQVKSVEPWNTLKSATACMIKDEVARRPQSNFVRVP